MCCYSIRNNVILASGADPGFISGGEGGGGDPLCNKYTDIKAILIHLTHTYMIQY